MTNPAQPPILPEPLVSALPPLLQPEVARVGERFAEVEGGRELLAALTADDWPGLVKAWASSEFISQWCVRWPQAMVALIAGDLKRSYAHDEYMSMLAEQLAPVYDDAGMMVVLRRFRNREMVRIAWRDIVGLADLAETLRDLSNLASACVDEALQRLHVWQCNEWGQPIGKYSGEPQQLVVLGMGKLGAGELNYSSDIDLIFAFAEDGETVGGRGPIANSEFFIRLGRRLIAVINQVTGDGYVFRVDMRLRPFGDVGPLAVSFDSMEQYYQTHGREWERYALIKADVIAGDRAAGAELMAMLRPFVYRRYLDYGAFESLREMKGMIERQNKRGMENNIKLGVGGIREVEFIGQAQQLIRGGRDKGLQVRPIQQVLDYLAANDYMPQFVRDTLNAAYIFLRQAENRLQAMADKQTHVLPSSELERSRLALAMGFDDYASFEKTLRKYMAQVRSNFEQAFAAPQREQVSDRGEVLADVWRGTLNQEAAVAALAGQGFAEEAAEGVRLLERLRGSARYISMTPTGRDRMDRLMPLLLGAVAKVKHKAQTLARVLDLIEAIVRRSAYLALLVENPLALSQLVKLCDASPWIASHLARYPVLLDELLDPRSLYVPLDRAGLEAELAQALVQVGDDLEQQMEVLRHFKQTHVLRVAAADVSGIYPLMIVSDHLTEIAEVIVQQTLKIAYDYSVSRYGRPQCERDGHHYEPGFLVVAYGKMGGIELGYGSDLDLVFLHGNYNSGGETDADKPVDNHVFFARLGQRLIHIMTTHTPAGVLYDIDTRLRPAGEAGPLVSSMSGFAKYQRNEAWTWEHQALVRTRVIAGSEGLGKRFAVIRRKALSRERDPAALQKEVREMRQRMRDSLDKSNDVSFDLKQGVGGIADIEFIVQYLVLRWSHQYPALLRWSDNIRQIETLANEGLIPADDAAALTAAYKTYRAAAHHLTLDGESARVPSERFAEQRREVQRVWHHYMDAAL